jgi:DNA-binding MarR family transcriptional regulator/GNAT superfamily N-acetyltransferase
MVERVRKFNRFYTREIGVLRENFLGAGLTLGEVRVLYEIAHGAGITAKEIAETLHMDAGYLSRLLRKLQQRKLVSRTRSKEDSRQALLRLTERGKQQFALQNRRQNQEVQKMIERVPADARKPMIDAMQTIARALGEEPPSAKGAVILREPRLGDMGWVVLRHGEGYADVYGWDERFEALVAKVVADFMATHDARRERAWVAERDGERLGFVMLVQHPEKKDTAKLRLLWVEPGGRGLGIGKALVHECTTFAKRAGYKKIVLWTNSELKAARGIYEREGYKLVSQKTEPIFAEGQMAEEWELPLS